MIGVSVMGLFCGVKNNGLLDEIYDLDKTLCDKEQEYCKLIADYNRLKEFNDSTDKIITKLVEETKIGGTK